jgi:thiosulfate dehydrogenase
MKTKKMQYALVVGASLCGLLLGLAVKQAAAHKEPHDAATLKAFDDAFMEQVVIGDNLFHGDADTEKKMGVTLSTRTSFRSSRNK